MGSNQQAPLPCEKNMSLCSLQETEINPLSLDLKKKRLELMKTKGLQHMHIQTMAHTVHAHSNSDSHKLCNVILVAGMVMFDHGIPPFRPSMGRFSRLRCLSYPFWVFIAATFSSSQVWKFFLCRTLQHLKLHPPSSFRVGSRRRSSANLRFARRVAV